MARHTRLSTLAVCLLGATTAAAQHVLLPFTHHRDSSQLWARALEQTGLKSADYAYVVDVSVGTPAQSLSLLISPSTGASWVPDANTRYCSPEWYREKYYSGYSDYELERYDIPDGPGECHWGSFNKSLSSTYLPAHSRYREFNAGSVDNTFVSGYNMTDKLAVGNIELHDYPIGLVTSTWRWIGVLGLGNNRSAGYYSNYGGEFPSVLDRMVSGAKIASPAYSIWLDNPEGSSGTLLFGAVDSSRYTGDLVRLDSSNGYSSVYTFSASVSAINGTTHAGDALPAIRSNDFPFDATFGPGEVFSYLPDILVEQLADFVGATYNRTMDIYTLPCDAAETNNTNLVFELGGGGGPALNVETSDLVLPPTVQPIMRSTSSNGGKWLLNETNVCFFGIQKHFSTSSYFNLGSSLLRRSYLVYDLANQEIALAPVKFSSGSDAPSPTIVAFESYGAAIPSSSEFCTTSYCRNSNSDSDDDDYGSGSGSGSGLAHWHQVAIGVGVSFGVVILVGAIAGILVCVRSRRGQGVAKTDQEGQDSEGESQPAEPAQGAAATQSRARSAGVSPAAALPVIQEKQEETPEPIAQAPQLPAFNAELARAITPPEPTASSNSNRASTAVSALSDDAQAGAQPRDPAAEAAEPPSPASPKGKGKEMDRSGSES
ncbi:acid protease [Parathielavia hyrcaniae]|uniref:Acid protease n=1 Tax=Parathielavia hyrcaniae TaxID=113614 RepID=A0AAN6SYF6_9PEZI|nr:acid protease [Parathielavia hyrcaniae]